MTSQEARVLTENIGCTQGKRDVCVCYIDESKMCNCVSCGPDSSVGIANDYGRDGPGSNPGGDEIFLPSIPAVEPTQPSVKWVTCLMAWTCC